MEYLLVLFFAVNPGQWQKQTVMVESLAQCETARDQYNLTLGRQGFAACSTVQHTSHTGDHRRNTSNVAQLFN